MSAHAYGGCLGHPAGPNDPLGVTVYCDGSCRPDVDNGPREAPRCPYCGLVMSNREAAEQGACNECSGGAWAG